MLDENKDKMKEEKDLAEAGNQKKKVKKAKIVFNDIAFLPNLEGKTPLHISIEKNNTRFTDKIV